MSPQKVSAYGVKLGKEWHWPSETVLLDFERQLRVVGSLKRGPATLLIKAVRSQRLSIEKLAKIIGSGRTEDRA